MTPALALKSLESLPRTPASDMKKLGWRGVMKTIARSGKVLVTNHDEPEAVIIPVAEYNAMLALLREAASRDEDALDALRRKFDERMASLKVPGAGEKLDSVFDKPLELDGRVIAGESY
jgi:PHD/YefM family antitoxin component YafN of YafNO toxin-antitoxin module